MSVVEVVVVLRSERNECGMNYRKLPGISPHQVPSHWLTATLRILWNRDFCPASSNNTTEIIFLIKMGMISVGLLENMKIRKQASD